MKLYTTILLLLICTFLNGQSKDDLYKRKNQLQQQKDSLQLISDSIKEQISELDKEIDAIEGKIDVLNSKELASGGARIVVNDASAKLWDKMYSINTAAEIKVGDVLTVVEEVDEDFYKVMFNDVVGYIHKRYVIIESEYELKTDDEEAESDSKATNQSHKYSSTRTYYTGSRGGCYYITSSGNKEYVSKDHCK